MFARCFAFCSPLLSVESSSFTAWRTWAGTAPLRSTTVRYPILVGFDVRWSWDRKPQLREMLAMVRSRGRAPAMAVCADDFAFVDLDHDRLPGAGRAVHRSRDLEILDDAGEVVEVENDRIVFTAIGTRMLRQVLHHPKKVEMAVARLQRSDAFARIRHRDHPLRRACTASSGRQKSPTSRNAPVARWRRSAR